VIFQNYTLLANRERLEKDRQCDNEIIERRRRVLSCCLRIIFENVVTRDQTGMVIGHPDARHPRVAIRIGELNISGDKNALIIRTQRRQNQRAKS